jgi:YD repeat-containing protein|nr:hypothetical protein [Kofleriaceae bacterium]
MRRAFAIALIAACAPAPSRALPTASLNSPKLSARFTTPRACGDDVALDGHATPDIRYSYAFDALGRMVGATGEYADGGSADTLAYSYDNLGNLVHSVESNGPGGTRVELIYDYDTLEQLADYVYSDAEPAGSDTQAFAMSQFTTAGQPTVEVISEGGLSSHYALAYDDRARLISATTAGTVTTYTYDDDARTLVIDTDSGAYHGEIDYDDDARELDEQWGGSASDAERSRTTYRYGGDGLHDVTYEIGSDLEVAEVDTLRYCASTP